MKFYKFVHVLDLIKIKLKIKTYSFATRLKYFLYPNVSFGKKISFYGFPKFRNYPEGCIVIGNNCTFLSKATSNLIGINRPCIISTLTKSAKISIGNDCGFSGTVIGAFKSVHIGNNVRCGANTLITDSDWHNDDYRSGPIRPVVIENNVWLGEGVKVLKGVTIGENTIIGAGSVVTKNIPSNVIAGGNPCKIIKTL
jgi:acetyltransferase-like isoleucine patch superfamily enzyme